MEIPEVRSKKELEILLERVPNFNEPKIELEQYVTPSSIASDMLWHAYLSRDIEGKIVIDLGCGTGKFAIGALLLGSRLSICVDIDPTALRLASVTAESLNLLERFTPILSDVRASLPLRKPNQCTVLMNPPFGIYSRGADLDFLKRALELCSTVYSIHKFSEGLLKLLKELSNSMRAKFEVLRLLDFPIKWFLPKHRRKVYYVRVIIIKIKH